MTEQELQDFKRDFKTDFKVNIVAGAIIRCIREMDGCDDLQMHRQMLDHYAEMLGVSDHTIYTAVDVAAKRLADLAASLRLSGKAWLRYRKANANALEAVHAQ